MRHIPHIFVDGIEYKICSKCKEKLTLDNFSRCHDKKDGLKHVCKSCMNAAYKKYMKNPEAKELKSRYASIKAKTNLHYKIKNNLACRLRLAIKSSLNGIKSKSTIKYLGCDIPFFINYIQRKFKPGMTWENHGKYGWHFDHIKPCALFDLSKIEEQLVCFHYTNLQPLWATDNLSKGKRY